MRRLWSGFTIIETTLVVAITALVAISILVGIGTSLRNQQYIDATNQTVDYFQGIYAHTMSVSNERPSAVACSSSGVESDATAGGAGTSGCLLLGVILHSTDGMTITSSRVIATEDISTDPNSGLYSEADILSKSLLSVLPGSDTAHTLDWGVKLSHPEFSMLVIRVPISGVVRTYLDTTSGDVTPALLSKTPVPVGGVTFCIEPEGLFGSSGSPNGFLVDQGASNSTGIQQLDKGTCTP
ncbi:MAG: hypothetical protein ABI397_01945 [Candidatus Saccharimonas sp.]